MSETYTLDEARRELARRECIQHGHSWNVVSLGSGAPVRIVCDVCGKGGSVKMDDTP